MTAPGSNHIHGDAETAANRPALGGSARRLDALDKVTGRACYVEDIAAEGVLYAKVLRSPAHHGRLRALDVRRAAMMPGVRRVLTAADIPNVNGFPEYSTEEPLLTPIGETLRMRGAPVALVIAESLEHASAALSAIEMEIEPLAHTFDMGEALASGALHIAGQGNELSRFEFKKGDIEGALTASDHVLETTYTTSFIEHMALEREALLARFDEDGRLCVLGGTHQPHNQQRYIAAVLGIPEDRVRIIVPPVGGSFGGKQDPWPFTAVALAAFCMQKPVKLIYSRRETFEATPKRHPYCVHYRIGATRAGQLTGLHVRIDCNTGGYDGAGRWIPNYALTAAGGAYRWLAVDGVARSIYTNGPKSGQFRGFGTAQSTFALECALDELIEKLGDDPIEFRLCNCIEQGEDTFLGYPIGDTLGYRQVLEAIRPHCLAFARDAEAYNASHAGEPSRRGVGLAGMWYRFGKAGSLRTEAHAELATDGHFIVYCSAPDYGQGIGTVMSQIAAESFGVSRDRVEVVNADTARVPNSDIQGASRATFFVGGAVVKAAEALSESLLGVASELLDVPASQLSIKDDRIVDRDREDFSVSLAEVAAECRRIGQSTRVVGCFDLSSAFPEETRPEYVPLFITGAHLADVLVDMETGIVEVLRVVAAHDVGRAINPPGAAGQIEGGVVMGMGAALYEEFLPDQTTDLSHYQLPVSVSVPDIQPILVEVPSRWGPHGVKGLGEAPLLPATPAIINAVSRAIGCRIRSIPATPERVLRAIYASQGRSLGA